MCSPGLRSAADLRVLREGRGVGQERDAARRVQGSHPARRGEFRAHQPAQEQPAALRRQRARRYARAALQKHPAGDGPEALSSAWKARLVGGTLKESVSFGVRP